MQNVFPTTVTNDKMNQIYLIEMNISSTLSSLWSSRIVTVQEKKDKNKSKNKNTIKSTKMINENRN